MTIRTLTADEALALDAYASKHGRTWKATLRTEWYHARTTGTLHALRNDAQWNFAGLDAYRVGGR
jgi:hypothetical protein